MNNSGRNWLRSLFQRLKVSLKLKERVKTEFKGTDFFGNQFFETNKKDLKGNFLRYYLPQKKNEILSSISPEWESWLR